MASVQRTSFTQFREYIEPPNSFIPFHREHTRYPNRSRRYEYADFPGEPQDEDSDGGGFNVDTIVMQNQHSARGIVLCPDTNHYMGHFSATIHETKFINTEYEVSDDPEDVNVRSCVTPYLVKLFIQKKQEEYAANKWRREIYQEMKDAADMYVEPPPEYSDPRGNERY
ncbi:hypothetical protein T492DRAFT_833003 [Pavlovales sp. CCMP2436]|nr:hypothetical protein T492DRAFT_833003 [Pavlovales sp. CCMP2436]